MEIFYVLTKYFQSRLLQNYRMKERVNAERDDKQRHQTTKEITKYLHMAYSKRQTKQPLGSSKCVPMDKDTFVLNLSLTQTLSDASAADDFLKTLGQKQKLLKAGILLSFFQLLVSNYTFIYIYFTFYLPRCF